KTTIGTAGTRQTVGLPGTGLSYTVQQSSRRSSRPNASAQPGVSTSGLRGALWFVVVVSGLAAFTAPVALVGVIAGLLLLAVTPRKAVQEIDSASEPTAPTVPIGVREPPGDK